LEKNRECWSNTLTNSGKSINCHIFALWLSGGKQLDYYIPIMPIIICLRLSRQANFNYELLYHPLPTFICQD